MKRSQRYKFDLPESRPIEAKVRHEYLPITNGPAPFLLPHWVITIVWPAKGGLLYLGIPILTINRRRSIAVRLMKRILSRPSIYLRNITFIARKLT